MWNPVGVRCFYPFQPSVRFATLARISHKFSTALRNIGTGEDFAGFASLQGVDPASSAPLPEAHTSTRSSFVRDEFCEKCGLGFGVELLCSSLKCGLSNGSCWSAAPSCCGEAGSSVALLNYKLFLWFLCLLWLIHFPASREPTLPPQISKSKHS